jgi:hypothetical protein
MPVVKSDSRPASSPQHWRAREASRWTNKFLQGLAFHNFMYTAIEPMMVFCFQASVVACLRVHAFLTSSNMSPSRCRTILTPGMQDCLAHLYIRIDRSPNKASRDKPTTLLRGGIQERTVLTVRLVYLTSMTPAPYQGPSRRLKPPLQWTCYDTAGNFAHE